MSEFYRSSALNDAKKIIVKAGTRLLIDREQLGHLIDGITALRATGRQVLLVSSGAVGRGMEAMGLKTRPRDLSQIQALAAIGQSELMALYSSECQKRGFHAAQLLLTASDLRNRGRYLNVMNCINALWEKGALPIVNENDPVSVDELKFGDNDTLAGMLGSVTGSQLVILLTTVDGLRNRDNDGNLSDRISIVPKLTPQIKALAGGTDDSQLSTGGMESKLRAASMVTAAGGALWIADGRIDNIVDKILAAEDTGTLFLPSGKKLSGSKRFLSFFSKVSGKIIIDNGAAAAVSKLGKSLLPSGVIGVEGKFQRGDTVEVVKKDNTPIARGIVNYSAEDVVKISGKHSDEVHVILGSDANDEVIHRDHLSLVEF